MLGFQDTMDLDPGLTLDGFAGKWDMLDRVADWLVQGRLCSERRCFSRSTVAVTITTTREIEVGLCPTHRRQLDREVAQSGRVLPDGRHQLDQLVVGAARKLGRDEVLNGPAE